MLPTEIHELVQAVAAASPTDPHAQTEILDRLKALRVLMRHGAQADLAAYLEAASLATEVLASSGGPTPERIASLVTRLVESVESAFLATPICARSERMLPARLDEQSEAVSLRMVHSNRLGEILVHHGRITRDQVDDALRAQRATGIRFGEALVMLGAATWEDIHHAIRMQARAQNPKQPAGPVRSDV